MVHHAHDLFTDTICLPLPPLDFMNYADEIAIYARFMGALRHAVHPRPDIRVLRAVQAAADMVGLDDAEVGRVLVGLGLRGPRSCFPAGFLNMVDRVDARRPGRKNLLGDMAALQV